MRLFPPNIGEIAELETNEILLAQQNQVAAVVTPERLTSLPEPVQRWLHSTGIVGHKEILSGWIRQEAQMKIKPSQRKWFSAHAQQTFTVVQPAFIWTVQMKMTPFITVTGRDKFVEGNGEMLIRMNSLLTLVNEKGAKLNEGTLQRFLGEIVWYPSAALSPYIVWEAIDEFSAKATLSYQDTVGTGIFHFNVQGDFLKFSALRYMGNTPDAQKFEWVITAHEHATMEGVRVPTALQATWNLESGEWTWLKLRIAEIRYNFQ
jgi:hypothetical protein